jgi:DNA-binding transcriptional ArsR family regulator
MSKAERARQSEDAIFAALAHPTRRQILLVLRFRGGAMTSSQIAGRFACRWPTVTRHLRMLEQAGLVEVRKKGRGRIYKLRRARLLGEIDNWARWFKAAAIVRTRSRR